MSFSSSWHPVATAQHLRAGENAIATLLNDQPLALWRSAAGSVQAWEDRCPHRGVPLSLGRVDGDRLACAYHGWQYAAQDGRCVAIPAMPNQAVPGKVCVKTYPVLERQGLVWVQLAQTAGDAPPPDAQTQHGHFLRSLEVARPMHQVSAALVDAGFVLKAPHTWHGALDDAPIHLYTQTASAPWCMLHLWAVQAPAETRRKPLFAAMRALRTALESAQEA
jgi:nitrite reductase/ring-hydroxylating ferredoxin subunit